jgi:hypothetical protein
MSRSCRGVRGLIAWRVLASVVAGARQVVGQFKFLIHIFGVKLRGPLRLKIRRDEGHVIVDIVPLGLEVDVVQIAHALVFSQAANGPGADERYPAFDTFIFGRHLGIADDVKLPELGRLDADSFPGDKEGAVREPPLQLG